MNNDVEWISIEDLETEEIKPNEVLEDSCFIIPINQHLEPIWENE